MTSCGHMQFSADDPVVQRLGLGAAALQYQSLGYAVLPLARAAKKPHPLLGPQGGVHWATRDPAMVEWAWGQDKAAGIGIATGKASWLVVIDLDVKGLHNGTAEFTGFLNEHRLQLPPMPTARTPSGGYHLYLRIPPVRVMVTGSRDWTDGATISQALAQHWGDGSRVLVSGHCPRGADDIAERIWRGWGGEVEAHPAAWSDGRGAGFRRNTQMAETMPGVCLAFICESSNGATHAAAEAERCGVPVLRWVWPDPQPWPEPVPLPAAGIGQRLGILPGVDIKGDGGYVAAAPTMITVPTLDGETVLLPYRWAAGCPCSVPMAPGWIRQWIESVPPGSVGSGGSAGPAVDLGSLRETGLAEGGRNAGLYRLACSLYARYGTGPEGQAVAWAEIEQVLARTDRRGFGQREVATILASARQFVTRSRERDAEQTEAARRWLTR